MDAPDIQATVSEGSRLPKVPTWRLVGSTFRTEDHHASEMHYGMTTCTSLNDVKVNNEHNSNNRLLDKSPKARAKSHTHGEPSQTYSYMITCSMGRIQLYHHLFINNVVMYCI